jgi:hypothetical protein
LHPHYLELAPEMTTEQNHQISGFLNPTDGSNIPALHTLDCTLAGRFPRGKKIDLQGESSKLLLQRDNLRGMSGGPVIAPSGKTVGLFIGGRLKPAPASSVDYNLRAISSMHIIEVISNLGLSLDDS